MNEELLVKLKLDLREALSSINKLENEVSNVSKSIEQSTGNTALGAKNIEGQTKATSKLAVAMAAIQSKLSSVQGGMSALDVVGFVAGWGAIEASIAFTAKHAKDFANNIKQLSNDKSGHLLNASLALVKKDIESARINIGLFVDEAKNNFSLLSQRVKLAFFYMSRTGDVVGGLGMIGKALLGGAQNANILKAALSSLAGVMAGLVTVIGAVALALTGALAIAGTIAAFKVSRLAEEAYHSAQQFGFSTQKFQEWSYVMERNGSSIEDLKGFLETLASEQGEVAKGTEDAIEKFSRLGLSIEEVVGSSQQDLFTEVVKRIQNIEDATEKTSVAYGLFGDEASRLMNVLNMSNADLERMTNNYYMLGGAMSDDLISKSTSFRASLSNMGQAAKGIANTLAEYFIPILQKAINAITKVLVWFNLLLRVMFGLDLSTQSASSSMDSYGGGVGKAANSMNKYTGATKAATKAAEELKKTTMGFDELNIVQNPNSSAGSGDSGSDGSTPDYSGLGAGISAGIPNLSDVDLSGMYEWFEKYKSVIKQVVTWGLIGSGILMAVLGFGSGNILMGVAGLALAGTGIAVGHSSGAFEEMIDGIKSLCGKIKDTVSGWWNDLKEILGAIGDWIYDNVIEPVVKFFKGLWESIVAIFKGAPAWFKSVWTSVKDNIANIVQGIRNTFSAGWAFIKEVWGAVKSWFKDTVITPVGNYFSNMWTKLKDGAKSAWTGIKNVFSNVTTWFKEKFTAAWTAVKNVFSTGGKIFTGIKEGIEKTFKTVVNGLIGGINKVIAVPFNAINKTLNKIRSVSIMGIEPFKKLIAYNALAIPQIPKLAKGGIIDSATLAMIGENGKEAVVPLENNTEWINRLVDAFASRNSAPSRIVLMLDGKELGWASINSINDITKQTGNLQLTIA